MKLTLIPRASLALLLLLLSREVKFFLNHDASLTILLQERYQITQGSLNGIRVRMELNGVDFLIYNTCVTTKHLCSVCVPHASEKDI